MYEDEIHENQHHPSLESNDNVKIKKDSIRKIVRHNKSLLDGL